MDSTVQGCFRNAESPSIKSESEEPKTKPDIKAGESESRQARVTPAELYGCLCHQPHGEVRNAGSLRCSLRQTQARQENALRCS